MKAGDELLGHVFNQDRRYEIPIFQRPYVWNENDNWTPLWHDIRKAAEDAESGSGADDPPEYFLGAFVTQHRPPQPKRTVSCFVIDGQQRLTTFQVFLAAARRVAAAHGALDAVHRFGNLIRNRVPADTDHPQDAYKVTPLRTDAPAFRWAMRTDDQAPVPPDPAHRLARASVWFENTLTEWLAETDDPVNRLDMLHFAVEHRIKVVSIFLDSHDDPQVIFEALNHRGVRLDAADLVKNTLFQKLEAQGEAARQDELHDTCWKVLDGDAWRTEQTTGRITRVRVDVLLSYWLSVQRGEESSVEHLFEDVKRWLTASNARAADVIVDIRRYADTMDQLQGLPLSDPVAQVIDRLEATRTTTPWPLLLFLHANSAVPPGQAEHGAKVLDSFLMRRAMCRMETKDYNRLFAAALAALKAADPSKAGIILEQFLSSQTATTRLWPDDATFIGALISDDVYNTVYRARLKAFLLGVENSLHTAKTEPAPPKSAQLTTLSVEHVMPQQWQANWPLPDDANEKDREVRANHIHRIGNLTLTTKSLNSSLSNGTWSQKRPALHANSMMLITTASILTAPAGVHGWTHDEWVKDWDEPRIDQRGAWIITQALSVWPRPQTSGDGLE